MQRLAFTLALGMLSALASSGLAPHLATAAEWPSSRESLTPCPLLSGNLKPAPARPADPVRPPRVSASGHELNRAASEMLVRFSALASALAESLATIDDAAAPGAETSESPEQAGDAKPRQGSQREPSQAATGETSAQDRGQSSKTSEKPRKLIAPYASLDDLGLVPDFQYGPYRGAIPTFLPSHDYRLGVWHSYDEEFRATFGLSPIGRPWLAGVAMPPVILPDGVPKAKRTASHEDRAVLDLVGDDRHSRGQDEVLRLNEQSQGLTPPPATSVADLVADAEPKSHRYWFEDYTFGYETGFGYRSNESYLDALLAASSAGPLDADAADGATEAAGDGEAGFELVIDGPTRYLFLREGPADEAPAQPEVASARHAPLADLDPLAAAGRSEPGWVGCEDSSDRADGDDLDEHELAAAPSETSTPELGPIVSAAARMLNDLGTAFIYLSCDLHHLAQRIDAQPVSRGRLAEEPAPAQQRVGQKIDTKDFFGL